MIINNGEQVQLDIPNIFTGAAGRQGETISFVSANGFRAGTIVSGTLDGAPVRLRLTPDPSFSRRDGGLINATVVA